VPSYEALILVTFHRQFSDQRAPPERRVAGALAEWCLPDARWRHEVRAALRSALDTHKLFNQVAVFLGRELGVTDDGGLVTFWADSLLLSFHTRNRSEGSEEGPPLSIPAPSRPQRPTPSPAPLTPRQNAWMEIESATQDLYRVAPSQFTAARDTLAAEARSADPGLAASLKKLRKPSVGAWLANILVFEQPRDVKHLVDLGTQLRAPKRKLDGDHIRRVSKEKGEAVARLVRNAKASASRTGQSVSTAASEELEATLEAAFADPDAAESLLRGRLSSGLRYSGLGFGEQTGTASRTRAKKATSARRGASDKKQTAAERDLKKAHHDAEEADARAATASRAAADAAKELTRLKAAEADAIRRSKAAHARVSAAKKKLNQVPQATMKS
jgi:hypothetical protein